MIDQRREYFLIDIECTTLSNLKIKEVAFDEYTQFENLIQENNTVYHLINTTVPSIANQHIVQELTMNVVLTGKLLDACVKCEVKKSVFISSS